MKRKGSTQKSLLFCFFSAIVIAVFCGIVLKLNMQSEPADDVLASYFQAQQSSSDLGPTIEISDNVFVGGSLDFGGKNVVIQDCEIQATLNLTGGNIKVVNTQIVGSGGIEISGGANVTLLGNTSVSGGGNIKVDSSNLNLGDLQSNLAGLPQFSGMISGASLDGVDCVNSNLRIFAGTITNNVSNNVNVSGGTIEMYGGVISASQQMTGVVLNSTENAIFAGGEIRDNKTGGGISTNSPIEIQGEMLIEGNSACNNGGGIDSSSTVTMRGGQILNNFANGYNAQGGGVYAKNFYMYDGIIVGNEAGCSEGGNGGGVFAQNATIFNGEISNNTFSFANYTGTEGGGGICTTQTLSISGNTKINKNVGNGHGGGIMCKGTLTISGDVEISENRATENGGGIYANDMSSATVSGVKITSNTAKSGSGIFSNGTFNLNSGTIENNSADGIYVYSGNFTIEQKDSSLEIKNNSNAGIYAVGGTVNFNGGTVKENKNGGFYASGATLNLVGGSVISNSSYAYGAGVNLSSRAICNLSGTTISENYFTTTGYAYGAGIYAASSTITMTGGEISGNFADSASHKYGFGVYVNSGSTFDMSGGTIKTHTSSRGGAVYNDGTFKMSAGTIAKNTATEYGGAIFTNSAASGMTISGSAVISDNKAVTSGGAIYSQKYFLMIGGTIKNNSSEFGGGVYASASFDFGGGSIESNTSSSGGAGICVLSGTTTMFGTASISSNATTTNFGAGVYVYKGTFQMDGGTISSNTSSSNGTTQGLGIYVQTNATANISGGTISGHTAKLGSAVYNVGTLTVSGGTISGNTATTNGDSIYGNATSSNTFAGSSKIALSGVYINGGKCFVRGSDVVFSDSTFLNLSESFNVSGTVTLVDSTITRNDSANINGIDAYGEIRLFGSTNISGHGTGISLSTATLVLGFDASLSSSTSQEYSQFSGNISDNRSHGIYGAYGSNIYVYAGTISNNAYHGVSLETNSVLTMDGTGNVSGNKIGVYLRDDYATSDGWWAGEDSTFKFHGGSISGNKNTGGNGGGIFVGINCTLYMNEHGGYWSPSVSNNTAENGGGIYISPSVKFPLQSGSSITNNIATSSGGGIYFAQSLSSFTCDYMSILDNRASNGGGIFFSGGTLNLANVYIENNYAALGGGIYCGKTFDDTSITTALNISGGRISSNSADNGGGLYARWSKINISNGEVGSANASNIVTYGGGGIFITNSQFEMTGGSIWHNNAGSSGGGIYFGSSNVANISGGTISNNSATSGGGIFVAYSNNGEAVTLSGGTITGNSATDGGGVFVSQADSSRLGTFVVSSGSISENTANNGGGIYSKGALTVSGGSIILNEATNDGGGIYSGGSLTVQGGYIGNISVTWNGGKYTINSDQGNTAGNDGGGIYAQSLVKLKAGAKIRGNNATNGGGIFASSTLNTDGGVVDYNEASAHGGGVYASNIFSNNTSGNFEVDFNKADNGAGMAVLGGSIHKNVKIRGNIASNNGGGIHFVGANATIDGSGGSILIGQENSGGYSFGNTAKQGGGIFVGTNNGVGANIKMNNVNIINNKATDNGGGLTVYKAKVTFGSGTKISLNHVSVQSGLAYGGGVVVNDCESAIFAAGSEVSQNYIEDIGSGTSVLNYSYAGGAGVYITGESTECYLQSNVDNANPAKFHANYVAGFDYSAGGNIYIDLNVKKFSMQQVLITGDGSTKQATIGGGMFIYTPELGDIYDDPSKVDDIKVDIHGGTFKDCLADYGGAIASIGSFKLRSAEIDYDGDGYAETRANVSFENCRVSSGGIGSAIFTAGMLAIGYGVYMQTTNDHTHDIVIASNEVGGVYEMDSYNSLLKTNIPNRTGSIYLLNSISLSEVKLNFCDFEVNSITQKITVNPNSMSNIESHYFKANQSKLLVTGRVSFTYQIHDDFVLPDGLYWARPFAYTDSSAFAVCISDKEQIFLDYGNYWRVSLDKDSGSIRAIKSGYDVDCIQFSDASGNYDVSTYDTYAKIDVYSSAIVVVCLDGVEICDSSSLNLGWTNLFDLIEGTGIGGTYLDLSFKYYAS